ncbi:MAG: hypothetical protein HS108_07605 [Planctomycetes bacterium]|jgi:hypothetical protein|nr:hypothetical protein [Planctomycetota bacterium]MCL4729461.1 hypothetical protein [Planctomycetota bacterium]
MQSLKCGQCGSPDIEFLPGGFGRCRNCKTAYAPQGAHPAPMPSVPVNVPPPFPQPPQTVASAGQVGSKVAWLLVLVLIAGAVGWFFFWRASPPESRNQPDGAKPTSAPSFTSTDKAAANAGPDSKTVIEVTPPRVAAELRDMRSGMRHSVMVHVCRYVNTGETVIVRPSVVLSLFDASGKRVLEQAGYASMEWLEPGQWCPVTVSVLNVPEHARAELKLVRPQAPSYEAEPLKITLVEWGVTRQGDTDRITGTVRNDTGKKARFVKIMAYGLDKEGLPVCDSYTFATESELAPGGESGFQVLTTTLRVGEVERYQLVARAMAGD